MRKLIKAIPAGIPTVLVVALIAYLSLAPNPFDINKLPLFPGADKLEHIVMYFGATTIFLLDYAKKRLPHHTKTNLELAITAGAMVFGFVMEIMQLIMRMGRSYDMLDVVSNCLGAAIAYVVMRYWLMHRFRRLMLPHRHGHRHHHRTVKEAVAAREAEKASAQAHGNASAE